MMKRDLLILFAVLLFVGCKHNPYTGGGEIPSVGEVEIPLSMVVDLTKAGNRDNKSGFVAGEKIGITAYNEKDGSVDFIQAAYFSNASASAGAPNSKNPEAVWNPLTWDVARFFKGGDNIYLYSYYPYSDGVTPTEGVKHKGANVATPYGPELLEVELLDETITSANDAIKQPDVLVSNHTNFINRNTLKTDDNLRLKFNHLLSQVQFEVSKHEGLTGAPTFTELIFEVPGKAEFKICAPEGYTSLLPIADNSAIYSIKKTGVSITTTAQPLLSAPIMVFPYSIDDLKTCKMQLKVNFVEYGDVTYDVDLSKLTDGFLQGGLNTMKLKINRVDISVSATVLPWVKGNEFELPVE